MKTATFIDYGLCLQFAVSLDMKYISFDYVLRKSGVYPFVKTIDPIPIRTTPNGHLMILPPLSLVGNSSTMVPFDKLMFHLNKCCKENIEAQTELSFFDYKNFVIEIRDRVVQKLINEKQMKLEILKIKLSTTEEKYASKIWAASENSRDVAQ